MQRSNNYTFFPCWQLNEKTHFKITIFIFTLMFKNISLWRQSTYFFVLQFNLNKTSYPCLPFLSSRMRMENKGELDLVKYFIVIIVRNIYVFPSMYRFLTWFLFVWFHFLIQRKMHWCFKSSYLLSCYIDYWSVTIRRYLLFIKIIKERFLLLLVLL